MTGASRGIGHATVKRFSSPGWRVIICSPHGFPENCPWEAGPEDHIQIDLANPDNTLEPIFRDEGAAVSARRPAQRVRGRRLRPAWHQGQRDVAWDIDTATLSPGTEKLIADIPMRRLELPEEVAKAIYFL